jgi:hypothetical protein
MEFTANSFIKAFTSWTPEEQQKVRDALTAPAPKKEKVVKEKAAPPAPVPAPAKAKKAAPVAVPVADDEARDKRLMGRMKKEEVDALSKEDRKRRTELKKIASAERKATRSPEEQKKIDERVALMQAGRAKSKAAAGGSPSAEEADSAESAEE